MICSAKASSRPQQVPPPRSALCGFRFPAEVITVAVRWYLRYGLSCRDVEELLAERGVEVDHVTVYRWVQWLTPLFADAARFARHSPSDPLVRRRNLRQGQRRMVLRLPGRRRARAGHRRARVQAARRRRCPTLLPACADHAESETHRARHRRRAGLPRLLDALVPAAWHHVEQYGTTGSRPTTAGSNIGCDLCVGCAPTAPLK
jgi:hypothetical protein